MMASNCVIPEIFGANILIFKQLILFGKQNAYKVEMLYKLVLVCYCQGSIIGIG